MIGNIVYPALLLLFYAISFSSSYSILTVGLLITACLRLLYLKNQKVLFSSIIICSLFFIRLSYAFPEESDSAIPEAEQVILRIKETSFKVDGDKVTFEGTVEQIAAKVMVNYYIKSESEKTDLINSTPKRVVVKGTFSEPNEPANFHQFNYKNHLKNKNISLVFNASSLKRLGHNTSTQSVGYRLDSFRQKILTYIDRNLTGPAASYTKILVFADKRSLSQDVMQSFKELGIVHLLSISGLHIVFIIDMITRICRKARISKESTHLLLLICLPFYGLTTGLPVSVFRAIGQTWIKLISNKVNIPLTPLDCWSAILMITLFIQPYSVNSVGFQLSYLISFTIIMFTHQTLFNEWSTILKYILLNVILLIVSIPVLTYHFYEFSWGVLFLNGLFIPFTALILLPVIILNLILAFLVSESVIFSYSLDLSNALIELMEKSVNRIALNGSFTFITGRLSTTVYFFMVCFIIILLLLIEKHTYHRAMIVPVAGVLICVLSVRYSPYGQVLMIDVNQGEAILIREPWGKGNYLIDTGGQLAFPVEEWKKREKEYSVGENIVLPVLKSEGVHALNSIIITHPDIDHYGALIDVVRSIKTTYVVSPKSALKQAEFQSLFPSLRKYGTIIKEAEKGTNGELPSGTVPILAAEPVSLKDKNNSSLVLLGMIGDKTWLFTGDLEADGEKELLELYPNLSVDILKVGHHGSITSTHDSFLNQLGPESALISAGKNNRYGHPHDDIVDKLTEAEAEIYRTDRDGAVRYTYSRYTLINRMTKRVFSFQRKREHRGE